MLSFYNSFLKKSESYLYTSSVEVSWCFENSLGLCQQPFSSSQGLKGLEKSQHLLLPLSVEARKVSGFGQQDH